MLQANVVGYLKPSPLWGWEAELESRCLILGCANAYHQ